MRGVEIGSGGVCWLSLSLVSIIRLRTAGDLQENENIELGKAR